MAAGRAVIYMYIRNEDITESSRCVGTEACISFRSRANEEVEQAEAIDCKATVQPKITRRIRPRAVVNGGPGPLGESLPTHRLISLSIWIMTSLCKDGDCERQEVCVRSKYTYMYASSRGGPRLLE